MEVNLIKSDQLKRQFVRRAAKESFFTDGESLPVEVTDDTRILPIQL